MLTITITQYRVSLKSLKMMVFKCSYTLEKIYLNFKWKLPKELLFDKLNNFKYYIQYTWKKLKKILIFQFGVIVFILF